MKEPDLKKAWKEANTSSGDKFVMNNEKFHQYRKKTSDILSANLRKGFILDILLKSMITVAALVLFIVSASDKSYMYLDHGSMFAVGFVLAFLLTASIASGIISLRKFNEIPKDLPVLESLNRKLMFLQKAYRKFMFGSALTAPMFVFTANMIYYHREYAELRFDPVLIIFLFLAFIISYAAQIPIYNLQKRELETAIADIDEEKAEEIKKAKKKQKRNYILWMILGCIVLIVVLILFIF